MTLTNSQYEALEALKSGHNVFLTGEAGTGKSFLLDYFVTNYLADKEVLITAPTGIAAINVSGVTLHRAFSLETDVISLAEEPHENAIPEAVALADVLIIDEISMCRLDVFEKVLKSLKLVNKKNAQVILVGDFLQLPPVLVQKEQEVYESYHQNKVLAFESRLWTEFNFVTKQLVEVIRQKEDLDFIDNLNKARRGNKDCIDYFNSLDNEATEAVIEICATNKVASRINKSALRKIHSKSKIYVSKTEILRKGHAVQDSDKVVPDVVELKVGAKVLLSVNLANDNIYNGQIGTVLELEDDSVKVDFSSKVVSIEKYDWYINAYDTVIENENKKSKLVAVAKYTQIPLKLAFAITIHKSQGQTFDKAVVHPYSWDNGQLYVALSRVKSSSGLYLASEIKDDYLIANQKVLDFYNGNYFVTNQIRRRKPGGGRKRKFNGYQTKTMRLPAEYEQLLNKLADKLSENEVHEDDLNAITKKLLSVL